MARYRAGMPSFKDALSAGDYVVRQAKIPGFYPPQVTAKALAVGPLIQAASGRAYKAHVKIAFGTDAGVYPHGENASMRTWWRCRATRWRTSA